jgi:hypothetical protein
MAHSSLKQPSKALVKGRGGGCSRTACAYLRLQKVAQAALKLRSSRLCIILWLGQCQLSQLINLVLASTYVDT